MLGSLNPNFEQKHMTGRILCPKLAYTKIVRKMGNEINEAGFSSQFHCQISGHKTEVVFQRFQNKCFLAITQFNSLPNLFSVSFDQQPADRLRNEIITTEQIYTWPMTVNCNFGSDDDETRSAVQFLIRNSNLNRCVVDLVVSLGLKQITGNILKELVQILNERLV